MSEETTWTEKPKTTISGNPPADGCWDGPAPQPIDPATGMHGDYYVLPEAERAKGFVRPLRRSYKHVGGGAPKNPLRDLTSDEEERYREYGYVKYEEYPKGDSSVVGKFWTQAQLDGVNGCGSVTRMGDALAATYARDPKYYGATFCCECRTHFPVGEFRWIDDGSVVGS